MDMRANAALAQAIDEPTPLHFCSVPEAAKILNVDRKTVLSAIYRRQLPAAKIGHNWRIDLAALRRKMVRRS